jgi:hypothetical protein
MAEGEARKPTPMPILELPAMAEWTKGAAAKVKARAGQAPDMVNTFLTPVPHSYSRNR